MQRVYDIRLRMRNGGTGIRAQRRIVAIGDEILSLALRMTADVSSTDSR